MSFPRPRTSSLGLRKAGQPFDGELRVGGPQQISPAPHPFVRPSNLLLWSHLILQEGPVDWGQDGAVDYRSSGSCGEPLLQGLLSGTWFGA